jgi:transcriptional regulator with XRE-family HTH domain
MATARTPDRIDILAGELLRELRSKAGLTLAQLDERLCTSPQQLQKYECGVNRISMGRLFEVTAALGTDPDGFVRVLMLRAAAAQEQPS